MNPTPPLSNAPMRRDPAKRKPIGHRTARRVLAGLARGFTLTELMVAMAGGLMISTAVFLMARQASRFYAREGRASTATLANLIGFERLRADIARTGYMASPNIREDPAVCGNPTVNAAVWPAYLKHLQSVWIKDTTGLPSVFAANGLHPQSITLVGNYASADQYWVRDVDLGGGGSSNYVVFLGVRNPTMKALSGVDGGSDTIPQGALDSTFGAGRAVRIVDVTGRHHYGRIVQTQGGTQPRVVLAGNNPPLTERKDDAECGVEGRWTGGQINVVNIVRYEIRQLGTSHAVYGSLYTGGPEYDATSRADLIREELDVGGNAIDSTLELITEYAVDLSFQLTGISPVSQKLETVGVPGWADTTQGYTDPITGPQRLRTVRATLSVRSREADRLVAMGGGDAGAPFIRFGVGSGGGAPYARVRSLTAHIALNNQLGVSW